MTFRITKEVLEELEGLAARGLSQEQIAYSLGVSRATITRTKKKSEAFEAAIKRGQAQGISTVSNALYIKASAGDVTSMIFYLKTRAPGQYNESFVSFDLDKEAEPIDQYKSILYAISQSKIPVEAGAKLIRSISEGMKILEVSELAAEIEAIKEAMSKDNA